MKRKEGFEKTFFVFVLLKLTILDVWNMPNGFMTNWVTPRTL